MPLLFRGRCKASLLAIINDIDIYWNFLTLIEYEVPQSIENFRWKKFTIKSHKSLAPNIFRENIIDLHMIIEVLFHLDQVASQVRTVIQQALMRCTLCERVINQNSLIQTKEQVETIGLRLNLIHLYLCQVRNAINLLVVAYLLLRSESNIVIFVHAKNFIGY